MYLRMRRTTPSGSESEKGVEHDRAKRLPRRLLFGRELFLNNKELSLQYYNSQCSLAKDNYDSASCSLFLASKTIDSSHSTTYGKTFQVAGMSYWLRIGSINAFCGAWLHFRRQVCKIQTRERYIDYLPVPKDKRGWNRLVN